MKTKTELTANGKLIAVVEAEDIHDKYFSLTITFPDGTWRKHFVSYNVLNERQDWNGNLEKELKGKKA